MNIMEALFAHSSDQVNEFQFYEALFFSILASVNKAYRNTLRTPNLMQSRPHLRHSTDGLDAVLC